MIKVSLPHIDKIDGKIRTSSVPFFCDIAKGKISGYVALHKIGTNEDVDTSEETVWNEGGIYAYLSTATTMTVSSSDANDDVGGSGVTRIQVFGQDANYKEQTEYVSMDGQNGVTTVNSYLRVYRMICLAAGATGSNEGIIYIGTGAITGGKPAVVYGSIAIGINQTQMSLWTVPAGKTFYLIDIYGTESADQRAKIRLYIREEGRLFVVKFELGMISGQVFKAYQMPLPIPAKSDIEIRTTGEQVNCDVSAGFDGWYQDE